MSKSAGVLPERRPRILYLTQFFEPEGVFKGLSFVRALRDRGFDTEVATGIPNYPTGKVLAGYKVWPYQRETMDGITVHRLPLYPSHDASTVRRSLNYLSFFVSAFVFCLLRGRRYDAIYVYHPPMTVGFAAALAGTVTRVPFIVDIQDLWPDSVTASGMSRRSIDRALAAMCGFVYPRAARIVAQCAGMGVRLAERGAGSAKVRTIYNWAEESLVVPQRLADLRPFGFGDDRFTFVYGGNFGTHQALSIVVDAAVIAAAREPSIQVLLVGGGLDEARIAARIAEHGTDAIRIVPGVPQTQIADVFAAADVLLVHLAALDFFEFTVPSKTQFYLASGKPILGGLVGEAAALIDRAGAGITVPPENADALAAAMVTLARTDRAELHRMGECGLRFYRDTLSFDQALDDTAAVIREIAHRR